MPLAAPMCLEAGTGGESRVRGGRASAQGGRWGGRCAGGAPPARLETCAVWRTVTVCSIETTVETTVLLVETLERACMSHEYVSLPHSLVTPVRHT